MFELMRGILSAQSHNRETKLPKGTWRRHGRSFFYSPWVFFFSRCTARVWLRPKAKLFARLWLSQACLKCPQWREGATKL